MFAVVVSFKLHPGEGARFLRRVVLNAETSRTVEPGCRRFDVCADADDPDAAFLYELYDSQAAFDAHLASEHFKAFDRETAELVADKTVRTYRTVHA
jgi:autoinducer 2-degrading protein